ISQTVGRKAEQNDAFFTSGIGLCSQDAPRYLQEACNRVEKQFRYSNAGSMACMVHMDRHSQTITVANVGINRVFILIRDKQTGAVTANRLSVGHRPNDPVEMTRIYMHGGGVSNGKVSNFLATSR